MGFASTFYTLVIAPQAFFIQLFLKPINQAAYYISLPPRYLLETTFSILDFIYQFLRSFETLFIFVGVAVIIGIIAGGVVHMTAYVVMYILSLHSEPALGDKHALSTVRSGAESSPGTPGRTVKAYREERQAKKAAAEKAASTLGWMMGDRDGLLAQTILEEDDSEF